MATHKLERGAERVTYRKPNQAASDLVAPLGYRAKGRMVNRHDRHPNAQILSRGVTVITDVQVLPEYISCLAPLNISKSKFVAGVQCLKRLYWQVYEPELAAEPDESSHVVLEQGREVGAVARQAFPDSVEVEFDHKQLNRALKKTQELIKDPTVSAIFEAAIADGGVLVRVDVLERVRANRWRLIEVKSSNSVKEHYLYDLGIQYRVVSRAGLRLSSACLMHLNHEYVYDGKRYNLQRLFTIEDLTTDVKGLKGQLGKLLRQEVAALRQPKPPAIAPGPQCKNPVLCEFYDQCHPPLPKDHVSFLPGITAKKVAKLDELGIQSIHDIPEDFPLNALQRRACECVRLDRPWFSPELPAPLKRLRSPLYFMDFETYSPAIPRYAGTCPYNQVPFQWSVHIEKKAGGPVEHHEFLAETDADPRRDFINALCEVLGESGSIVTYNRNFEHRCLSDLAKAFPEFKSRIKAIQTRLWDLWPVIRKYVYHPNFARSFSLKSVLPALVPELRYDGMEVGSGAEAGPAWAAMVSGELEAAERLRVKRALLAYCKQDTFGLVQLLEVLRGKTGLVAGSRRH